MVQKYGEDEVTTELQIPACTILYPLLSAFLKPSESSAGDSEQEKDEPSAGLRKLIHLLMLLSSHMILSIDVQLT